MASIPPPPYSLLYPESVNRKPLASLHDIPMHPLIAATYHNTTKSPLCSLPDRVLIKIMSMSDRVTKECLRRTSRVFLRLYPAACASTADYHLKDSKNVWAYSTFASQSRPHEKQRLQDLLDKDDYCSDCRDARQSRDWQARLAALVKTHLRCVGCDAHHPACLFTPDQRKASDAERQCIGHQGTVRLCQHEAVSWFTIKEKLNVLLRKSRPGGRGIKVDLVQCQKDCHVRGCHVPRSHLDRAKGFFKPSHRYCCPPHPTLRCDLIESPFVPPTPSPTTAVRLEFVWSAHMGPMERCFGDRFRAEEVESKLRQLYEEQGRFICPRTSPWLVAGAGVCDPSRCNCLYHAGKSEVAWHQPPIAWYRTESCRVDPDVGLSSARQRNHEPAPPPNSRRAGTVPWVNLCYAASLSTRMIVIEYVTQEVRIAECNRSRKCLSVNYNSEIFFAIIQEPRYLEHLNAYWIQALDPDSYNLTNDVEGFGVYWCRTESCQNYYKYGKSRLGSVLRIHEYTRR